MPVKRDHIQMAIPPGGESAARAFWCDLIGLKETDKPESLRALTDAGHKTISDTSIPGRARFFTEAPFGNRLEFLSTP